MLVIQIVAAVSLLFLIVTLEVCAAWAIDVGSRKLFGRVSRFVKETPAPG